jgi:hypothetical protein
MKGGISLQPRLPPHMLEIVVVVGTDFSPAPAAKISLGLH